MSAPVITRAEAFRQARAVLDAARRRRDSMPIRQAAEAAAVGSTRSADEIELILRRLHRQAAEMRGQGEQQLADAA
ncbi:hypothetical protein N0X72_25490 [Streptomyces carpaticus]|uniref:hypothetical protein n=1 Tax=Streptomyces carpaticus TaxID=285558 RepID=UPI002209B44F|nr:hypothetical protein N0X72_25490 [Streptomyces carpaticus]